MKSGLPVQIPERNYALLVSDQRVLHVREAFNQRWPLLPLLQDTNLSPVFCLYWLYCCPITINTGILLGHCKSPWKLAAWNLGCSHAKLPIGPCYQTDLVISTTTIYPVPDLHSKSRRKARLNSPCNAAAALCSWQQQLHADCWPKSWHHPNYRGCLHPIRIVSELTRRL